MSVRTTESADDLPSNGRGGKDEAETSAGKLTLLRLWGEQAGRVYYLHDANHNVTGLADESGQVLERYGYGAYGSVTVYDPQWQERPAGSAYGNTVLYGGYQWDAETALYCVRNRYYHPSLGRWISRDPIGYGGGSNLYGYVGGRPIGSTDPMGLAPTDERDAAVTLAKQILSLGQDIATYDRWIVDHERAILSMQGALSQRYASHIYDPARFDTRQLRRPMSDADAAWTSAQFADRTERLAINRRERGAALERLAGLQAEFARRYSKLEFPRRYVGDTTERWAEGTGWEGAVSYATAPKGLSVEPTGDELFFLPVFGRVAAAGDAFSAALAARNTTAASNTLTAGAATAERVLANIRAMKESYRFSRYAELERQVVAYNFFRQGGFSADAAIDFMKGLNFALPVTVETLPAGTVMIQWVRAGGTGKLGNFFAEVGTDAHLLGINPAGRVPMVLQSTRSVQALRGTAGPIIDTWTVKGVPFFANGGGRQFFVVDKAAFVPLP